MNTESNDLMCAGGCGLPYKDFGFDVLLPNYLWNQISPVKDGTENEGGSGVLCATCMVRRLAELNIRGITALRLLPIDGYELSLRAHYPMAAGEPKP